MRIAFDATALYGRRGGIENALWNTFSHLRALDRENRYLVFVPRDAPTPPPPENALWEWRRLSFDGHNKARRILWQQLELPLLLRREKCDILHAWNYVAPAHSPVPVVLTVQDLIALNRPRFATRANRFHYRAMMPRNLKTAARVLVTTPKIKAEVLRRAPRADVRVIPLGIDEIFFETPCAASVEAVRRNYELPPRFLLYVGNFEPKKNLPGLLQALKMLPDAPPLVIAGGIKPWPQTEKMLRGVQKLGFIPREDLPLIYGICEAFCFPSLCEGFGLPVLEALACGTKVLASKAVPIPGLSSVAELCEPRFPGSIAASLERLLQSPDSSAQWSARRDFAAQFRWENAARDTLAVYREFL
jgi:glycosyltransferase involved in cell wall biosynthesis